MKLVRLVKNEKGFSLVEVLISVAILGAIGATYLSGLSTVSKVLLITDSQETAKNLAESQMEYVKHSDYALVYSPAPIPPEHEGYTASIGTDNELTARDSNIQKITVTIERQGKELAILEGYKTNR